ncbi:glycosyltransferase [Microbacterium sp. SS28]|uniref:glycosyltransferase n=1 Tax=Microbacterium sp. SS28 TaxID=2919948 RepID=UPI001FA94555|nr:glycosyltransferase [Microbacterium sp. SS28]
MLIHHKKGGRELMLERVIKRGARGVARIVDGVARRLGESATFLRLGPRGYSRHRKALNVAHTRRGATYANGVTTTLTPERAAAWHRVHWNHLVIVVHGAPRPELGDWIARVSAVLRARVVLAPELASEASRVAGQPCTIADGEDGAPIIDLASILEWMHRECRRWDLVLIDTRHPLPGPDAVIQLQHAAHEYHHDQEIGVVTPAYGSPEGLAAGYQIDRRTGSVVPAVPGRRDYAEHRIPRYVLTAAAHGLYLTSDAVDRIDIAGRHLADLDLDAQVGRLIRHAWAGNFRTLCLSSTVFRVEELPRLEIAGEQRQWILERGVATADGARRIIFVLNATSISGGIRAVFELANGLADRGFDVAIWSLQGEPTWFDLRVPVVTYRNYEDLLLSLRNEDAIKVATWWETAEIVWLASVNHGIPVYLIQEFETWFYPDDEVAQSAVVASYRHEFASITEADYQQHELADVGVTATLIPHGYDSSVFRVLPDWQRDDDTVLALGRSFFQKNFAMTERAWRRLGEDRPTLQLFGTEPDILDDERANYITRPRDAEVNELYNTAAVFVQTSRHEGFCLPILEAMAAGCPVVATDSHGNRGFCRDGENCVIVGQDDDEALASVIARLLGDPAERARLAVAGLATAAEYAWPVVLDSVAAFYDSLAIAGSAGAPLAEASVGASDE